MEELHSEFSPRARKPFVESNRLQRVRSPRSRALVRRKVAVFYFLLWKADWKSDIKKKRRDKRNYIHKKRLPLKYKYKK